MGLPIGNRNLSGDFATQQKKKHDVEKNNTELSSGEKAQKQVDLERQNFIKLLTTQLKNQDPTSPIENAEITQQMIGFNAIEQHIKTNTHLESLESFAKLGQLETVTGFIGKVATISNNFAMLDKGKANFSYELMGDAVNVGVSILDKDNNIVRVMTMDPKENGRGSHKIFWNGIDNNGKHLPDGKYHIKIKAINKDNKIIPVAGTTTGIITKANLNGKLPTITVNDIDVSLNDVLSVKEEEVSNATTKAEFNNIINLIGKEIEANFSEIELDKNDAILKISYTIPENIKEASLIITDLKGTEIRTLQAIHNPGIHKENWDGKLNGNLERVKDGKYLVKLRLVSKEDKISERAPIMSGKVNEIKIKNGKNYLLVDNHEVKIDQLVTIKQDNIIPTNNANQTSELNTSINDKDEKVAPNVKVAETNSQTSKDTNQEKTLLSNEIKDQYRTKLANNTSIQEFETNKAEINKELPIYNSIYRNQPYILENLDKADYLMTKIITI